MKKPNQFIREMMLRFASLHKTAKFTYEYQRWCDVHFIFVEPSCLLDDEIFMEDLAEIMGAFYNEYPEEDIDFVCAEDRGELVKPEFTILPTEPFEIPLTKSFSSEKAYAKARIKN